MKAQQEAKYPKFDFEPHFSRAQIQSILDNPRHKYSPFHKLKTLMDIEALRAYIAHSLADPLFFKNTVPEFQKNFTDFINEKTPHSGDVDQFRKTQKNSLRTAYEHSLTAEQFDQIKDFIHPENEVLKVLTIVHALTQNHLKDLESYLKQLPPEYQKFRTSLSIHEMIISIDKNTFARELSPVIIHGLAENKKNGKNLTEEDWKTGLKHTFDSTINTFQTQPDQSVFLKKAQCPFSKLIRHVLATKLMNNNDGTISVSPEPKGGALAIFITKLLANRSAPYTKTQDIPLHAPSIEDKTGW